MGLGEYFSFFKKCFVEEERIYPISVAKETTSEGVEEKREMAICNDIAEL